MSEQLDDDDDDWCELCGSIECVCNDAPPNERPGERLERIAKKDLDLVHQGTQELLVQRMFPDFTTVDTRTVDDFERELDRRPKVEIVKRRDGSTYRRRV